MTTPIKIAPSILSADFTRLGDEIKSAERANADMIHIDVMDGCFVPNITMGALVVAACRRVTTLPLDVHLMIVNPADHIAAFAEAGAHRITVHVEADAHLHRTISEVKSRGCQAGVALNPHTPAAALTEILPYLDLVIVMTVNPGFGGQNFISGTMQKVSALRHMAEERGQTLDIEVDGGINAKTAPLAAQSGANVLIAGSAVFNHPQGVSGGIDALRSAIG